ncbi:hypothetical protein [Nostoc sphaeroides]|uniref:Uncharacterized protein n=1 Tax=Nostoc sphaeroides CCNUC1 TaxID=2653204 RepID=A0A5P8VT66_9NOSO|nr:hypothetical protein [Nostoc sphaeroides]MCC5628397.1 hypothetical protein [Nostoc sphaeroides CHAB 2801]QFS43635.1 hypothetical protein GXM_01108 [Nostoc sphaeroides CCNUC1]
MSQLAGFRLRSTLNRRGLSAVETRFTGTLFLRKSLSISSFSLRPLRPWRFVKKSDFDKEF